MSMDLQTVVNSRGTKEKAEKVTENRVRDRSSYYRSWRAKNIDKIKDDYREYYEERRDAIIKRTVQWGREHPKQKLATNSLAIKRVNQSTLEKAYANGSRWDNSEDLFILNNPHMTAREIAFRIGRSLLAVKTRRQRLNLQTV